MKKRFIFAIVVLMAFAYAVSAMSTEFWASKNSNKYHYPTCKSAQKIKPQNLIKFNTPEDATKAGYLPCKVCKPPVSSKAQLDNITLANVNHEREEHRSGCCSWHRGVCGCDGDRVLCCDGTLSPSCMCGE